MSLICIMMLPISFSLLFKKMFNDKKGIRFIDFELHYCCKLERDTQTEVQIES